MLLLLLAACLHPIRPETGAWPLSFLHPESGGVPGPLPGQRKQVGGRAETPRPRGTLTLVGTSFSAALGSEPGQPAGTVHSSSERQGSGRGLRRPAHCPSRPAPAEFGLLWGGRLEGR